MKTVKSAFKFKGGVHPDYNKELARGKAIEAMPCPKELVISMSQHLGAPAKCLVKVGDYVERGQLIGEKNGFISVCVRASASGLVKAIEKRPGPAGGMADAVILDTTASAPDPMPSTLCPLPPLDWRTASREEILKRIEEAGICGMGGAGFPTNVKLNPPPGKRCEYLILNGAECEPYLCADHHLMLEKADRIRVGVEIMRKVLGECAVRIAIEANKPDAIAAMEKAFADISGNVEIVVLPVLYPQGSEKHQIYATVGRIVPEPPALPIDVGCVVENVGTVAAIADAVEKGEPLLSRVTTVSGDAVAEPKNILAPCGTKYEDLVAFCGGVKESAAKVISGGTMMGFAVPNLQIATTKTTSGLLLLTQKRIFQYSSQACINCGRCVRACPMNLNAAEIAKSVEADDIKSAEDLHVMTCIECGACSFSCPAYRPITQFCRRAKNSIRARIAAEKAKAAAAAKKVATAIVCAVALIGVCEGAKEVKFREFKNLPDLLKIESGGRVPLHSNYGWSMQAWERQRRLEILRFFTDNEFGHRPVERPKQLAFAASHETVMGGKAEKWRVRIAYRRAPGEKEYGFNVVGYRPVSDEPVAPMLTLFETNPETLFDAAHPEREIGKWPVTKILARGYAALALDVNEIAADAPNCFKTGVFACFDKPGARTADSWGALSGWAWGASRVMDWLVTAPEFDALHVSVGGYGPRATAALWAGITDERFRMAALKNSGCGGLKLNHAFTPGAELIADSVKARPHHFCGRWAKWADRDREMPYDQHELLALMVPRFVKVGTDAGDPTIGSEAEFDCCVAASPIWWLFGVTGLDIETCPGNIRYSNRGGHIGHHMLTGRNGLCMDDWSNLIDYSDWSGFRGFLKPNAKPVDVPDALTTFAGKKVTTREEWEKVRRPEILKFFRENLYGATPYGTGKPPRLSFAQISPDEDILEGRAVKKTIECRYGGVGGDGTFKIFAYLPKKAKGPVPSFVWISIDESWYETDKEIDVMIKRGYGFFQYRAEDYAPDFREFNPKKDAYFTRDVYARLQNPDDRDGTGWGSIAAWAWGASRVMDWIETQPALFDAKHVGLVGLSRCGKTALWGGANDTRFAMVCPAGSGCSGSRLNRIDIPQREPFWHLQAVQHFWFCRNARKWAGLENFMPCDVNALAACVAPRILVPTTGDLDQMAAPIGDFWTAYLASPVWKLYGLDAIDPSETFPDHAGVLVGRKDLKGFVYHNYHVGGHCVEAYDWNRYMDIGDAHGWRQ